MRYEVKALEADLAGEPIDAPKDPEHYKSEIVLVKHALNGDAVRAQREGGHAALVSESVPLRLIKVAVQLLPEEDRAVVARMLAEQRLALLKGTLQDDSSRACPCCGKVCGSAAEARYHLAKGSPSCSWTLFFSKMTNPPYCRGCGKRDCNRMKGGMRPFATESMRDKHEAGGTKGKGLVYSRMHYAGYGVGTQVYVDFDGANLNKGGRENKGGRDRREPFRKKLGIIEKIEAFGTVTILFDTLEMSRFQGSIKLTRVDGTKPPYVVPRKERSGKNGNN
jgi:hypothetical protein